MYGSRRIWSSAGSTEPHESTSADAARLLALELFREDKISLGRAAELSETPVEAFMEFAGQRQVPLHYGTSELEADRQTMQRFQK